jgi:hypothetical protein
MKKIIFTLLVITLFNCDNGGQVQEEIKSPTSFLLVKNETWLIGEKVIEGTVTNKATNADYSNIVILVHYFSNSGVNIGTERVNEYNILKAGQSREYKASINPPALVDNIKVTIERAAFVDYNEKGKYD